MFKQNEICIKLDNPSRSYLAGQVIHGQVILHNEKSNEVKEVSISLEGSGRVRWAEKTRTEMGRGKLHTNKSINYHIEEKYILKKISLAGGDGHNLVTLPAGKSIYSFQFTLSSSLPSSFTSKNGMVSYSLEVIVKRPFLKLDGKQRLPFTVNGVYDLNLHDKAWHAQQVKKVKGSNWVVCRKGSLSFILKLPSKSGYVPGEILDFTVEIINSTNKKICSIIANLVQNITYNARSKSKHRRRVVAQVKGPDVGVGEHEIWWAPKTLQIPAIPPTKLGGVCHIIDVQYSLVVILKVSAERDLISAELPVLIGTIPLRSSFDTLRQLSVHPLPLRPSRSQSQESISADSVTPSAPVFSEYPDLPPPTYAEAVAGENFLESQILEVDDDINVEDENYDPSAPPLYSEMFVPNYITYT